MTKVYDFSTYDIRKHNFVFAEMTEAEIEEKKKALADFQKNKITQLLTPASEEKSGPPEGSKPVFRPKIKPSGPPTT